MQKEFFGVYAALLTPFEEKGGVKEKGLRALSRFLVAKGLHGLYICGSTGEGIFMTTEERMRVAEIVKDEIGNKAKIICHIGGATNTNEAVKLARHAAKIKMDGLSSIPPIYYQQNAEGIRNYYRTLAESTGLPFIMYYIPQTTGVTMTGQNIADLAKIKNMTGIKYTGSDFYILQDLINKTGGKWNALSGPDEMFLPALTMGVDGSIGSTQNCIPEVFLGIYESFMRGDIQTAMRLQRRVTEAVNITGKRGWVISRKTVLKFRGIDAGYSRAPLQVKLSAAEEKDLRSEWKKAFPEYSEAL